MNVLDSIAMSPEDVARWMAQNGPGGFGDPYDGLRTAATAGDVRDLVQKIADAQFADSPDADEVDFSFVRETLLEAGYHLALSETIAPLAEEAFLSRKGIGVAAGP